MSKQVSILFVNNDMGSHDMLEHAVRELSVRVVPVSTWDEAKQRILDTDLALIVVDNRMCQKDFQGFGVLNADPEAEPIPILMVLTEKSGMAIPNYEGIVDWIEQVNDRNALSSKVQLYVDLYSYKKQLATVSRKLEGFVKDTDSLTQKVMELDSAKSDFLSGISHTVHTTMNGVIGMLDIALDEKTSEKVKDCLYTARASANGLVSIMNDIVDISSLETGQILVDRRHCSLSDILLDVESVMHSQMSEMGSHFDMLLEGSVPDTIYTDPVRLRQCLFDLVNSTTKELKSDKVVLTISSNCQAEESWVHFEILNLGALGKEGEHQNLCQSYRYRIEAILNHDDPLYDRPKGVDLGLMVAYQLSDLLGGRIQFKSDVNEPLCLTLAIPFGLDSKKSQYDHRDESGTASKTTG